MKKFLLVSYFALVSFLTNAQCTIDTACAKGICPDTLINLPQAYVNTGYNANLTVVVPPDTTFDTPFGAATFAFDSVDFENWNQPLDVNLPPGILIDCGTNPNNPNEPCMFYVNNDDCMNIVGMVSSINDTGDYVLSVKARAYLTCVSPAFICGFAPKMDTAIVFEGYHIMVNPPLSVNDKNKLEFSLSQNIPNPVNDKTNISFHANAKEIYSLRIYNVLGELVDSKLVAARVGENQILYNASNLQSGIYTYSLSNGKEAASKRMIVNREVR